MGLSVGKDRTVGFALVSENPVMFRTDAGDARL